ncbi:MAG: FAD-dependent oxidoreductase [Candidatus Bipolaricaulota bacterium]|nr:FAD-dependent oxidoreductase [Candidatus Bipolaricaulota bacterium]MDW8126573.1 FAD-dependent oxidoreductase [Candidatus Bipolaricaulota bacterium]
MRIAVIGAGVVSAFIARELSRYEAAVHLTEMGFGITKASSALVRAGFHDEPSTLQAKFSEICQSFPFLFAELALWY